MLVTLFMGMVPTDCVDLAAAGLAALAEEATARAAAKPASDLTTDDSGWIYRICADGAAEVLGHADASAEKLSIPYALSGAWVTRIGENAFAENAALKSIFIPGSITEIADTAFSGSSELIVRAYNGADALKFAQKRGFSEKNLSEYDFFDEVIDLSELKSAQWSLQGNARLSISAPWAQRIEVGSKLYIPPCRQYASGMPMVATSVTATETGVTAVCSALEFTESVESYHAENVPLYMDAENTVILADGFEVDSDSVSVAGDDAGVSSSGSLTMSLPFKVDHKFKNGWKLTGSFTISNTITASVDYGFFKINKAELSKKTSYVLGTNLDFGATIIDGKYDLLKDTSSSEEEFEFAKVPVVAPNGLFTCYITLGLVISGSGEAELKADWSTTEKYTYADGKLTHNESKSTPKVSLNMAVKASAMVECGFVFGLGFGKLSIEFAKISVKAGPEISLGGEVTLYSYTKTDDGSEHEILSPGFAFDVNLVLKVDVEIGLLDTKWCAKATIFTGKINVLHLYWDIDGMKWASSKKLTSTSAPETVRVRFSTGTSSILSDQQVSVGGKIEEPPAPTRKDYTFLGWTKSIGSTLIWNFDRDTVSKDMTLYAVWENNSTGETEVSPTLTPEPETTPAPTATAIPTPTPYVMSPEEEASLEYLVYERYWNETSIKITGFTGEPTELVIPKYIDGLPVTNIGFEAFYNCSSLTSVTIPDSVTSIEEFAFSNCSSLKEVYTPSLEAWLGISFGFMSGPATYGAKLYVGGELLTHAVIPDSVTSIDGGAFRGFSSLTSVVIPDSVTSIGASAFENCSSLESINIPDSVTSIGGGAFENCSSLTSINIPDGVTSIGGSAFSGCSSLTSINIPDGVTSIGYYAFSNCSSLTSINIPDSVTSIGDSAFSWCRSLTSVVIPDSVTSIGEYAFSDCSSLTSVVIPDSVTSIEYAAFGSCSNLTSINIPDSVTRIGDNAFGSCSSLESVSIGDSVTRIGEVAFYNCNSLTSISIGNSVTSIGEYAFYGCSSLESINIPDSVTSIGGSAFKHCYSLTSVVIPDSVTNIGRRAFDGCRSLTSVVIPDSVTSIGDMAFPTNNLQYLYTTHGSYAEKYFSGESYLYYSVQIIYLDDYLDDMEGDPSGFVYDLSGETAAITGYNGSEIYLNVPEKLNGASVTALAAESIPTGVRRITLPASVQHIDAQAFRWAEDLYTITVAEGNPNYYSVDGVLYAQNGTLVCYPRAKKADAFTPAERTVTIGDYAFYGADKLGALNLVEGITSIGSKAIYECAKLKTLSLPASLKKLGDYAVYGCRALTRIDFAADLQSLGDGCFVGCGDELAMFGPLGANTLESHADTYLLNYNEYGVTYMMYGELLARVGARAGELLGEPLKPEDGEMSFKGWSQEENGALWDYEKDVMPEADITLYAVWKYDFSYEAVDGGVKLLRYTGDKHRIRVPESIDGAVVAEIAENCFEGLTEICLIGEKGGMAESFAANGGYDFEALTHTLSFRSNGGTYAAPRTLCATDVIEAPSVSRSNYNFLGWYTDENCTEAFDFTDGMPAADLTLYAGWEKIDANVSDVPFDFDVNETGLTIIAYTGQKHTVSIPEEINGVAVTEIGAHAFDGDQIIFTLKVASSVTEIGEAAFAASRISEITFESGLEKIGAHAFDSCYELQSISLPDTLSEIGAYAFQDCMNLLKIELPSALKAIPEGLLAGCGFLEEVKLPAALESIGEAAFDNCDSLTNIELGEKVCEVSPDAFEGCEALAEIEVSSANMYYRSVGGVLLSADGLKLICYPQGRKDAAYSVPSGVTALGDGSMAGSRIEKLVLNEELAYIGADALKGSRYLAELKIPSDGALSMIGEAAFQGCTALEELTLPASLAAIEESAFDGCALKSVTFGGDTLLAEGAIPARSGLTIYGAHGWDAEDYAELYGIRYIDLKSDVPVTGIRLRTELTLERGEIARLEATLIPENSTETEISWSSSDASVAAVDASGAVSGRYTGTAVITATAKNGSTAKCTVTVIEAQIEKLMLDRTEMLMALGDIATLTASLSSGASISVDWESDDAQVVSVENGVIRALRVGSATITASAQNCEAATCCVTVTAPEKMTGGLILPRALTKIGEEAFAGGEFESAVLPEGAESIGTRAFADCANLLQITIPASVNSIAADAFDGCEALVIFCAEGSEAERYAAAHGIPCAIEKN